MSDLSYTIINGKLICKNMRTNALVNDKDAINQLKYADEHVNKLYFQGNKLIIKNEILGYNLEINYFTQFMLSTYKDITKNIINDIKYNSSKIQTDKHKDKKVKKGNIVGRIGVSVAPLVLVTMLTTNLIKKEEEINNYKELEFERVENITKDEPKSIDHELNTDQLIREKIAVDYTNEYENRTQAMIPNARLDIVDNSIDSEIKKIQEKFYDLCLKAAKKWGISVDLLLGMLTQESHGNEENLMQIEFSAWEGQVLRVYNYEENRWIKVVLTNSPDNFKNVDMTISSEELKKPYTNIATASMLLNHSINLLNTNNIFAVLEYYNKGHGNFNENMDAMERGTGKSREEILSNPTDVCLIDYSHVCGAGDPFYIQNVMQYVPDKDNGGIYFYRMVDDNKELVTINLNKDYDVTYAKSTR